MDATFWFRQTTDRPLFEDLIWNKPENRLHAGKLLIIGGNAHEFAAPGEAYNASLKAGIGRAKVLLPAVLQKTIGQVLEDAEFAPSNKSGGFSRASLAEWLSFAHWADGVMVAGDLGRNSETAIVIESFLEKFGGLLVITKDAIDYFVSQPHKLATRLNTTLVLSFAQLQKIIARSQTPEALRFSMTIAQLVESLHRFSREYPASIVVEHNGVLFVAHGGQVSTTKLSEQVETWRVRTAATASVWLIQNPNKPFEALTTAVTHNT